MIGVIVATFGLAAMSDGSEPEEDEDLLTLLGEGLSVQFFASNRRDEWTVVLGRGQRFLTEGRGREDEAGITRGRRQRDACAVASLRAIHNAFLLDTPWTLQELRDAVVSAMVAKGQARHRKHAYELLDVAHANSHNAAYRFLSGDPWFDDRTY